MRALTIAILLLTAARAFAEDRLVVVAAAREGRIELFDASLQQMADITVFQQLESAAASADGRRLYIAQDDSKAAGTCCGLFSLELETLRMCSLGSQALFAVPSPDGRFLFTQAKGGVDVLDAHTLSHLPMMKGAGAYNLQPSPDGHWLLGVTNSPDSAVDIFDLRARAMVRHVPIPAEPAAGAWGGDRFYLFEYAVDGTRGTGSLWELNPEWSQLPPPRTIGLPDFHGACDEPVLLALAGTPGELFLAEAYGFKIDRRLACPDQAQAGIYGIRPATGSVRHFAAAVRVHRMVATPDGHDIFVIQTSSPSPLGNIRLLHLDVQTGRILHSASLGAGEWNLSLAHVPPGVAPHGTVRARSGCSR